MFDNLDWIKIAVVVLIGLFIFGPDRLPKLVRDGVNIIRQLRRMATNAAGDLSRELGTDISIEDLNPKTLVRKHILSEEDQDSLTRPFREIYSEARETTDSFELDSAPATEPAPAAPRKRGALNVDAT